MINHSLKSATWVVFLAELGIRQGHVAIVTGEAATGAAMNYLCPLPGPEEMNKKKAPDLCMANC